MGIQVEVPVDTLPFSSPYIRGRNGDFEITALRIHQWGQDDPKGDGAVDVHGIGKRGEPIVGGFRCLMAVDIDALCKAWIEARGGLVVMPSDDGVTGLLTMCSDVPEQTVILSTDVPALQRQGQRYVGVSDPDKWEYHLLFVDVLPTPEQGSQEQ